MSRYIDAYKLWDAVDSIDTVQGLSNAVFIYDVIQAIENEPTADVQKVRHGRWKYKILDNFKKVECTCTHCGWSGVDNYDSYVDISDFEYCPNCGAKMDLEEK